MSQSRDSLSTPETSELTIRAEPSPGAAAQETTVAGQPQPQPSEPTGPATAHKPTLTVREVLQASWSAYRNNLAPILVVVIGTLAATAACGTLLTGSLNKWYMTMRLQGNPNDNYIFYACYAVLITGDVVAKMFLANGSRNIHDGKKVKLGGFFSGCLWYSGYFTGMVSCFVLWYVLWNGGMLVQLSTPDWGVVGPVDLEVVTLPAFLPRFIVWLMFYCIAVALHSLTARFSLPIAQHEDIGPFQTLLKSAVLFVRSFRVNICVAMVLHFAPILLTTAAIFMLGSGHVNAFMYSFLIAVPLIQFFLCCPLMILSCTYIYRKVELPTEEPTRK